MGVGNRFNLPFVIVIEIRKKRRSTDSRVPLPFPGIDQQSPGRFEISNIASHQMHTVTQGRPLPWYSFYPARAGDPERLPAVIDDYLDPEQFRALRVSQPYQFALPAIIFDHPDLPFIAGRIELFDFGKLTIKQHLGESIKSFFGTSDGNASEDGQIWIAVQSSMCSSPVIRSRGDQAVTGMDNSPAFLGSCGYLTPDARCLKVYI